MDTERTTRLTVAQVGESARMCYLPSSFFAVRKGLLFMVSILDLCWPASIWS